MNLTEEANESIKELKRKGHKLSSILTIHGNANSTAYKVNTEHNSFFLKIYPNEKINQGEPSRFTRETNFLEYINAAKLKNVPELIYKSQKHQTILTSWNKGEEIKEISSDTLQAMIKFIANSNKHLHMMEAQRITQAKDSWQNSTSSVNDVKKRWRKLIKETTKKKKGYEAIELLKYVNIEERIEDVAALLERKTKEDHWRGSTIKQILSQSDMSINNTKKNGDVYSFFDFEYAGWDDPAKLATDILYHPDHQLTEQDEVQCVKMMRKYGIFRDNGAEQRIMDTRELAKIKWLLIMCNIYINDRSDGWGIQKIRRYTTKINR